MLIFICDDDRQELKAMEAHLAKAAAELSADVEIAAYTSGESLVKAVEEGACPALAVLDIYMEGMNGVETGCSLRRLHPDVFVAFLTASRDFAVDAFELDALHYMVKPVTTDMFCALLTRLMARMNRSVQVLELPIGRGEKVRFPIEKINRIISKNRGVEISVQGRSSTWLPCLFREVEAKLHDEPDFLHLGRGCMVNLNSVRNIDYDLCYLKDGESFLISRRERSKVQNCYSDFLFRKMNAAKEDSQW